MRHVPLCIAVLFAAFASLLGAPAASAQGWETEEKCGTCGDETYGTTVAWVGTPKEAAVQAKKEEKLVFVLHVSGNFEDPAFT